MSLSNENTPLGEPSALLTIGRAARRAGAGALKVVVATLFGYALLFNFSVVRGNSMAPGIHDGDRILVNHLSLVFGAVERGDVVVMRYPLDPSIDYIKRVVGLPGDHVVIDDGVVTVNGVSLDEPYVGTRDRYTRLDVTVMPEHYFVLGDNRLHSSDSREFGQVPGAYLRGQVDIRVWPPDRVGPVY
jgi:signal peptidase I